MFPGWTVLLQGAGAGNLANGGTYVSYYDAQTGGFTLTIVKLSGAAEAATFQLSGAIASIASLNAWHSTVVKGATDSSGYYNKQAAVPVTNGRFTVNLVSGDMYTLTTVTTGGKGSHPQPPPQAPFPVRYNASFADCALTQEAKFW